MKTAPSLSWFKLSDPENHADPFVAPGAALKAQMWTRVVFTRADCVTYVVLRSLDWSELV